MTNNFGTALTDKYNAFAGAIVTILTAIFGVYWYIFAAYFLLNVIDWLTGWYKSRKLKEESSKKGQGIKQSRIERSNQKAWVLGCNSCSFYYQQCLHTAWH